MNQIIYKKCGKEDLEEVCKIGALTFEETFAAENTKEDMEKYLQEDFNREKVLSEMENPSSVFYLAQIQEGEEKITAGYMKVNFDGAQTEEGYSNSLELQRIYVAKAHKGKGIGSHFMDEALHLAREKSVDYVWLGVWEKNFKAQKFYQDKGFIPFGQHTFILGEDRQTDYLMKKML